jgi:hypothetical protein
VPKQHAAIIQALTLNSVQHSLMRSSRGLTWLSTVCWGAQSYECAKDPDYKVHMAECFNKLQNSGVS